MHIFLYFLACSIKILSIQEAVRKAKTFIFFLGIKTRERVRCHVQDTIRQITWNYDAAFPHLFSSWHCSRIHTEASSTSLRHAGGTEASDLYSGGIWFESLAKLCLRLLMFS
jgi:hypothetical protein